MARVDYSASGVEIREDLLEAHSAMLEHIASPGTWWTGEERVAIARESRAAADCSLCRERKGALSPASVSGEHDRVSELPEAVVDVAHRVRSDPGRLSRAWFDGVIDGGVTEGEYAETIGVVTLLAGMDFTARALGAPAPELPSPRAGAPSRYRPASAKAGGAWLPMIAPEDAEGSEEDLYPAAPMIPNIMRALSIVPDQVRELIRSSDTHYVKVADIANPMVRRDLDRAQIELVAARVSAMNECFY